MSIQIPRYCIQHKVVGCCHVEAQVGTEPCNPACSARLICMVLPALVCAALCPCLHCYQRGHSAPAKGKEEKRGASSSRQSCRCAASKPGGEQASGHHAAPGSPIAGKSRAGEEVPALLHCTCHREALLAQVTLPAEIKAVQR